MRFRPDVDYYEVLQVHPRASQEMIKKAYRTLMGEMRGHPDLGGDEERAKLINEAYTIVSDPDLRRAYDAARARSAGPVWDRTVTPGAGGFEGFDRIAGMARRVALSVAVVASALVVARFLRSPTLDLADLAVMAWLLIRIWNQVSLPGRA